MSEVAPGKGGVAVDLYLQQDMTRCARRSVAAGEAAVLSRKAPDKDGPNEDGAAVFTLPDGRAILAVADGMGGHSAGLEAASHALRELARAIERRAATDPDTDTDTDTDLRNCILDGFEAANHKVTEMGVGAGATLAVVEIDGDRLRTYHVGDAAILLVGQRGKIKHMTVSHSPVGYAVEAGVMDEEEAIVHEDRHLVSNAVGSADMKIEIGPVLSMAPRDTLVLGSDGLFDNLRVEEVSDAIRTGPLHRVCARVEGQCRARMQEEDTDHPGKPDDLTFVVFRPVRGR